MIHWISSKCRENFLGFYFNCVKKAIAQLNIRRENFRASPKIHKNCETFLSLNFCRLRYHTPICLFSLGTDNQKSRCECRYSASNIIFLLSPCQGVHCYKIVLNGLSTTFIQQCILSITTISLIESSSLPAYLLFMDWIVTGIYRIILHEY